MSFFRHRLLPYWKNFFVLILPAVLLPLPLLINTSEARCGYVVILMALLWMTEAIPLAITSLLPVVLLPAFAIMSTDEVCIAYMKETNVMFIGGIIVAIATEHCKLHKRVALRVLMLVGASPRWLMLGFMGTTMFLSMWISNTAATLMMVPIVQAVVDEIFKEEEGNGTNLTDLNSEAIRPPYKVKYSRQYSKDLSALSTVTSTQELIRIHQSRKASSNCTEGPTTFRNHLHQLVLAKYGEWGPSVAELYSARRTQRCTPGGEKSVAPRVSNQLSRKGQWMFLRGVFQTYNPTYKEIRKAMLLSVAYAANIGGTGTITGTGPNLAFKGIVKSLYPQQDVINFASWMAFNVPSCIINIIVAWLWLQLMYLGFKSDKNTNTEETKARASATIKNKYEELGSVTLEQVMVLFLFIGLVALWFFRDPQFIPGWASPWEDAGIHIEDATAAIFIVVLMFMIPMQPEFWRLEPRNDGKAKSVQGLVNWKICQEKIPWGLVLLLGGGFALSDATKISGLSDWLGSQLEGLKILPESLILIVVCIMTASVTEVASNTATANILLPVLAKMCELIGVNPLYLMLPATVTCSYAFMLPVATPPNAIVFTVGKMKVMDMVKTGFVMNLLCILVLFIITETFGVFLFDIKTFPTWANATAADIPINE
ncbi:Na(+)/citrate cotransporter-like isoform X1 [Artemia franciscana]|uniref:Solute carrier family 13 member 2 n=1 Tax=Artemia franciscana TaxID=6661 RepID=A0AA88L0C2_ARTSF|nr:hypothetical protein QYM36_008732 [Artemia franciscana]